MKLIGMVVGLSVMVGIVAVSAAQNSKSRPIVKRSLPGGVKVVSVNKQEESRGWSVPTISEIAVYASYYLGGGKMPGQEGKSPGQIHADMAKQVETGLKMAEDFGVATGPTAFDPHIDRTPKPAPGKPRKNPYHK